jgi:hypothetical protein
MGSIGEDDYRKHMASVVSDGFTLDPPGYERLNQWTHMLMNIINARACFQMVLDHPLVMGNLDDSLQQQAFFVSGIMAYCRCYASSGPMIPKLDSKQVYLGSKDGMDVHNRLIGLRNTIAAHTDKSDLVRLTLAVKDEPSRVIIRHLSTIAIPTDEVPDFLEAVAHTEHFVTMNVNKYLNHLETKIGKKVELV